MSGRDPARAHALRWLQRGLILSGIALLVFAGGARLAGEWQKRRALRKFAAAVQAIPTRPAAAEPQPGTPKAIAASVRVDTSLWAEGRIRKWEESLRGDVGTPLAVLSIPKIGLEVPVLPGSDELTLNRAVGLVEGSVRPGEKGNACIAGHRDGFFRGLKDVHVGDEIEVRTLAGPQAWVIQSTRIVGKDDVAVLDDTPDPALTLVTCYPFYFVGNAPQRFIVRAARRDTVPGA